MNCLAPEEPVGPLSYAQDVQLDICCKFDVSLVHYKPLVKTDSDQLTAELDLFMMKNSLMFIG